MAGLYIHIPFCKKACHYCNFHFSTSLKNRKKIISSMIKEIEIKSIGYEDLIETIYFGGGTPSLLSIIEIDSLIKAVIDNFKISKKPEITLEANPDDLNTSKLKELSNSLINRLSIGIQSFNDQDLKLMNRSHNSFDSINCIDNSLKYFDNISIDLIYGMPNSNLISWEKNLNLALNWDLNHISAYALTVEPKTALEKYIKKEIILPLDEEFVYDQFNLMYDKLLDLNYINYELSSFAKKGYFSKNNSGYWLGKKYVGIGPSSHSFDGFSRSWNVSNNKLYVSDIQNNKMYHQKEKLTHVDQYNEYIMTGLRTMWGISLSNLQEKFGKKIENHFVKKSKKFIESKLLIIENDLIKTSKKGKFLSDGIASELFLINR
ncbi:radical SAM family heme chaperone HemW [Flavobacteriaceae bacterium]|nr:radical SAM family heme chaperone HemW [Flavobacteriaceae bacterium]